MIDEAPRFSWRDRLKILSQAPVTRNDGHTHIGRCERAVRGYVRKAGLGQSAVVCLLQL